MSVDMPTYARNYVKSRYPPTSGKEEGQIVWLIYWIA